MRKNKSSNKNHILVEDIKRQDANVLLIAAGAKPRRCKVLVAGIIQVCRAQQPSQKRAERTKEEQQRSVSGPYLMKWGSFRSGNRFCDQLGYDPRLRWQIPSRGAKSSDCHHYKIVQEYQTSYPSYVLHY